MPYDLTHPLPFLVTGDEQLFEGMSNKQADLVEAWIRTLLPEQANWRAGLLLALKAELLASFGEPPWGDRDIDAALLATWQARGCDTPILAID